VVVAGRSAPGKVDLDGGEDSFTRAEMPGQVGLRCSSLLQVMEVMRRGTESASKRSIDFRGFASWIGHQKLYAQSLGSGSWGLYSTIR
jgi:hypothetical protein